MPQGFDPKRPIYLQIYERFKNEILAGTYVDGQQLPSVRELALAFKVNPNTVQRALLALEQDGLCASKRTLGRFMTLAPEQLKALRRAKSAALAKDYATACHRLGMCLEEAIAHCQASWPKDLPSGEKKSEEDQ